jgi:hypothetical protein
VGLHHIVVAREDVWAVVRVEDRTEVREVHLHGPQRCKHLLRGGEVHPAAVRLQRHVHERDAVRADGAHRPAILVRLLPCGERAEVVR